MENALDELQNQYEDVAQQNFELQSQIEVAKISVDSNMFDKVAQSISKHEQIQMQILKQKLHEPKAKDREPSNEKHEFGSTPNTRGNRQPIHKVFNGKRPWSRLSNSKGAGKSGNKTDPDLNDAIDKIEQMTKYIDNID